MQLTWTCPTVRLNWQDDVTTEPQAGDLGRGLFLWSPELVEKEEQPNNKQATLLITQIHQFSRGTVTLSERVVFTRRNTRGMTQTISLALNTLAGVLKGQLKRRAFAWLQILPQICFAEVCLKSSRDKDKFPYRGIPSSLLRVKGSTEPQSDLASISIPPGCDPGQIPNVFTWL